MTEFEDAPQFHSSLIQRLMEMDQDPEVRKTRSVSTSGTKIHYLSTWGCPEADLINARAGELYKRAFSPARCRGSYCLGEHFPPG